MTLTDNNAEILQKAVSRIRDNIQTFVAYGFTTRDEVEAVLCLIILVTKIDIAVVEAVFIFEAAFEDIAIKHEVLPQIESNCPAHAIIGSNRSSFRVGDMAVIMKLPIQIQGNHLWNPPHLVPLVEVICEVQTATEAIEFTCTLLNTVGKCPGLVRTDVAGFVGNRLQHALRREAIALVAQGVAMPEDIDLSPRHIFGMRLPLVGPLEMVDLVGLDLILSIQNYLLADLDRSTGSSQFMRDKVGRGEHGAKICKGFFEWPAGR